MNLKKILKKTRKHVDTLRKIMYYSLCWVAARKCNAYKNIKEKSDKWLIRLLGQAVKTPPFHGGIRGSIPLGVTKKHIWEHSSAGRASALQAEGHRFEPCCSHHIWPSGSVG